MDPKEASSQVQSCLHFQLLLGLDSSPSEDDDGSSSSSGYTPKPDATPTKTGENEDESPLDVQLGQQTKSPFAMDYCFGQFDGEYDMAAEDFGFHERVMHHLGGHKSTQITGWLLNLHAS